MDKLDKISRCGGAAPFINLDEISTVMIYQRLRQKNILVDSLREILEHSKKKRLNSEVAETYIHSK